MKDVLISISKTLSIILIGAVIVIYSLRWVSNAAIGTHAVIGGPFWLWCFIIVLSWFLSFRFFTFVFAVFGLYAAIWILGWPWYGALAFYFPIVTIYLGTFVIEALADLIGTISFRKYWKSRKTNHRGY